MKTWLAHASALALVLLCGCDQAMCPEGTVELEGRCRDPEELVDASVDAFVGVDAPVGPDAATCDAPSEQCDTECIDTTRDVEHCGDCETSCADGETCVEGECFDPVIDIAVGFYHSCALRRSGSVWCWGGNDMGQLGTGGLVGSEIPLRVPSLSGVVELAAGGHSFSGLGGTTCAIDATGAVWCWGRNSSGQVGDGTMENRPVPTRVPMLSAAEQLVVGQESACAATADRRLWCWGLRTSFGTGTGISAVPTRLSGIIDVVTIAGTSGAHVCARGLADRVSCVGVTAGPMFGGDMTGGVVEATSLGRTSAIDAGLTITCALAAGALRCVGHRRDLGIGSDELVVESTPQTPIGLGAVSVFATGFGGCAVDADGVACWGAGLLGGDALPTPERVAGISSASQLAVGSTHACALIDGRVWCWGRNTLGQLGDGTRDTRPDARPVSMPPR